MREEYEINRSTMAILSLEKGYSRVIEEDEQFIVNKSAMDIINDSCKFFGSSYMGRFEGTKYLIGINYKAPIIIEETNEIIFFPTGSPRFSNCNWICLSKVQQIEKRDGNSVLQFKNGLKIDLDISVRSLENQILRATLLESKMRSIKLQPLK